MSHDTTLLAHFYRASVLHADVWRQRLDATTNWAVVTTAALITFAFGGQAPHFVLLMALVFTVFFLVMESRRYQIYHVWDLRIRALHRFVMAPALRGEPVGGGEGSGGEATTRGLSDLASHLASTWPRITLLQAAGYRIRRNYGPLFTIILLAWLLKLWTTPQPVSDASEFIRRAAVGMVPGAWILAAALLFFVAAIVAAIFAPSEHVVEWSELASPAGQLMQRARPGTGA